MDRKIERAIKHLIDLYTKLEDDLLMKLAEHFIEEDEFQGSDFWRIQKLQEMGIFNQEVIKIIARDTGKTEEEVIKALEEIGIEAEDIPGLTKAYKDGKITLDPETLKDNKALQQIIKRAQETTNGRLLDLNSRIVKEAKKAYLNVLEEAYLKTTTGTHSYAEAITEALGKLADKGITTLTYQVVDETGEVTGIREYSIEAAVRRDVLTEARNLNHEITEEIIKETEPEYLYLSEHLNCREQHFSWQGTIIKAKDLEDITGYGEVDGLGGINCRHYFEPYWGEARGDDLKQFSEEECEKQYFYEQHQRYLERGIRRWKRKALVYKAAGMQDEYEKAEEKVREWALRNQTFIELLNENEKKLKRDFTREAVAHY